jgi:hypothetical protein
MEYVAGIPITACCDRHKLTVRQRMELFIQRRTARAPEGDHPSRPEAVEHSGV